MTFKKPGLGHGVVFDLQEGLDGLVDSRELRLLLKVVEEVNTLFQKDLCWTSALHLRNEALIAGAAAMTTSQSTNSFCSKESGGRSVALNSGA